MPAAALSTAASVGGGLLKAGAAGKAGKAAGAAADNSRQFINGVYNTAESNLNPTIHGGIQAGNALAGLLGIGGDPEASRRAFDNFRNSTNYNFLFDQGTQAVKTANAPSFNSGATAKALLNYGQGMAGNALSGYESMLAGQQTLGANSALGLGNVGSSLSGSLVNANQAGAAGQGSAAVAKGNALTGAFQGALGGLGGVMGSSFGGASAGGALGGAGDYAPGAAGYFGG